jgi:hypothetical protein
MPPFRELHVEVCGALGDIEAIGSQPSQPLAMTSEPLGFSQVISRRHHFSDGCLDLPLYLGVRGIDLDG